MKYFVDLGMAFRTLQYNRLAIWGINIKNITRMIKIIYIFLDYVDRNSSKDRNERGPHISQIEYFHDIMSIFRPMIMCRHHR